jgi:hypothetical protein
VIRRSFRIGLTLGLLAGLAFALAKIFGARPDPLAGHLAGTTDPWPRLTADPTRPAPATVALVADPDAPAPPAADAAPAARAPKPAPRATKRTGALKAAAPKAAGAGDAAKKAPAKKKPLVALWVEPKGAVCPTSHPVKAKLTSKIFHVPGMLNYERTNPDRCYRDAAAAEADGLRPSKK